MLGVLQSHDMLQQYA